MTKTKMGIVDQRRVVWVDRSMYCVYIVHIAANTQDESRRARPYLKIRNSPLTECLTVNAFCRNGKGSSSSWKKVWIARLQRLTEARVELL